MVVEPGMLLLATPALMDPNFADTVVMLLDVNDEGALGIVLNRPSMVAVSEVLDEWADLVAEPEVLFRGGPVSVEGAIAIGLLRDPDQPPVGWQGVVGGLGVIDLETPAELVHGSLAGLRVFAGYAGWGAQQLQEEIDEGSWYVVSGTAADAFRGDTTGLWRDVMRRQPGMLAWHATRPLDPELN